jgi:hypothetical protein
MTDRNERDEDVMGGKEGIAAEKSKSDTMHMKSDGCGRMHHTNIKIHFKVASDRPSQCGSAKY